MKAARVELLQTLAERIREIESTWHSRDRSAPPGASALEDFLPEVRLSAGSLLELLSNSSGTGTWTLALLLAKEACSAGKALVVVDTQRCFYPPAVARMGIDLERLILVQPAKPRDVHLALEQSLRCVAVGAVVGWCDHVNQRDGRRLQLAAERGGGLGFLLLPFRAQRDPSFATARLRVGPIPSPDRARRLAVEVARCRGGKSGGRVILELDDETSPVRVLPRVAAAAPVARAARASG